MQILLKGKEEREQELRTKLSDRSSHSDQNNEELTQLRDKLEGKMIAWEQSM